MIASSTAIEPTARKQGRVYGNASDVVKMIKDKDVKFVDLRFTDPRGKMQHVTADASCSRRRRVRPRAHVRRLVDRRLEGHQRVRHDADAGSRASAHIDPFFAQTTLALFCDILEPSTGEPYERDPRSIAKRAEAYMKQSGRRRHGLSFGPEAEFFVFDDVRFATEPYNTGFRVDSTELPSNSGTEYEMGNLGHRPRTKGGYFPVPPIDSGQDMRSEMLSVMAEMGVSRREAPPRSGGRPARARHQVRADHDRWPTTCRSTST